MIELEKFDEPDWITQKGAQETAAYIAAAAKDKPSPWRHPDVVTALKKECSRKCMYCESFIDDDGYSAVEHIKPKKDFEHLVLDWDNLGLVCSRCNTNKGEYWSDDPELQLLNPYTDSPGEHLDFRGPLTVAIVSSSRGRNTVRKLKFMSRDDLLVSRMRKIEDLQARLHLWQDEETSERRALYAEDVVAVCARDREFSAVLTAYAIASGFPMKLD